tara:strand:- start:239 stop:469 length:231 start_codon:yes stop_codon:yes gene_type:complete
MKDRFNKSGLTVEVRNNNVDKALRVLKKKLQQEGLLNELRKREYFVSRGEKKRLSKAAGRKRHLKELQKRLDEHGF